MDGHGSSTQQHGTAGPRLKKLEQIAPGTYRVVIENPDGTEETITATQHGDIVETPYGSYPIPPPSPPGQQARTHPGPQPAQPGTDAQSWLVEENPRGTLRARIPLRVAETHISPGQRVERGQSLLVAETMKMLHEVTAPCTGTVEEIAQSGASIQRGQVLARIRCSE